MGYAGCLSLDIIIQTEGFHGGSTKWAFWGVIISECRLLWSRTFLQDGSEPVLGACGCWGVDWGCGVWTKTHETSSVLGVGRRVNCAGTVGKVVAV